MTSNGDVVVMFLSEGTREEMAMRLRRLAEAVETGEEANDTWLARTTIRPSGCASSGEEPMFARFYGVCHSEAEGNEPIAMFSEKPMAEAFARGEKVGIDTEDRPANEPMYDYCVNRSDVGASVWNSWDEDPHEEVVAH